MNSSRHHPSSILHPLWSRLLCVLSTPAFACASVALPSSLAAATSADLKLVGDWKVRVTVTGPHPCTQTLRVAPPASLTVTAEKLDSLPLFNPNTGPWAKGAQLRGVRAQETTTPNLLDPQSLVLRTGPERNSPILRRGLDYEADLAWGTIGRCTNSALKEGQPAYATFPPLPSLPHPSSYPPR